MTNVFDGFNPQTEEEINATIETLKSKYVKQDGTADLEALLKKAAHAERHIKTLEKEATERSSSEAAAAKLEEILAKIEAKSNARGEQLHESETDENGSPRNDVDIDKLLEQKLSAYDARNARERNRQMVRDELIKTWGSDYTTKLNARARELGEDITFLETLAAERPQTFLRLIKEEKGTFSNFAAPPTTQRLNDLGGRSGMKTYADFEKIRKEDPARYKSMEVQKELYRLTAEYAAQGKSFTET